MMFIMIKSEVTIAKLIYNGIIPEIGEFDVTESLIDEYQATYKSLYEKVGANIKSSNKKYARKLAGMFLMKENQKRLSSIEQAKITKLKYNSDCGIVYIISNPSFPNCYKIGMTKNLQSRLKIYQTYDPNRAYKVEHYRFVKDARLVEQKVLEKFKINILKGEWIKGDDVKTYFIETIKNI